MRDPINWLVASFAASGASVGGFALWIAIDMAGLLGALGVLTLIAAAFGVYLTGEE